MYEMMFYGGLILFVIGVIVSIILFVRNHVAKIIGDLTGYNAKRAMKRLEQEKEERTSGKQKTEDKNEKKRKTAFLEKIREGRTDVLVNTEEITDRLTGEGKRGKTARLEQSDGSNKLIKGTKKSEAKKKKEKKNPSEMELSEIFQMEEDMTVLGGEIVTEMPTTLLRDGDLFKTDERDFGHNKKNAPTSVLKNGGKSPSILPNGISAFEGSDGEEETELLNSQEETTEVLDIQEDTTEVLDSEEKRNWDAGEENTELLQGEEVTSLLAENDVTEVLQEGRK